MGKEVIIIGAGIGGLSAGIRLALLGYKVRILEARHKAGGLASGLNSGGFSFDSGPYILLDKPGLDWAFSQMQIDTAELQPRLIESVYQVLDEDGNVTDFNKSIETTAAEFELQYAGSGQLYKDFVKKTFRIHQDLKPLTFKTHPGPIDMITNGSLKHVPFMLRSLGAVMRRSGLPATLQRAVSIWTHIAGQEINAAPSPMAFVPGLFHNIGAYYPKGGMNAIPALLIKTALAAGVEILYGVKVTKIKTEDQKATGVETGDGMFYPADAVVSNSAGIGTYTELAENFKEREKEKLNKLPLQSPGMCVYMAVKGKKPPYYIRFKLKDKGCVAFVQPGLMEPELEKDGWFPARLITPLDHSRAGELGIDGQNKLMDELLGESWWQDGIAEYKVLHKRTTYEWGKEFNLYHDSMNPVMTAKFMLKGRIAHRSPFIKGLYLAGSSTHPGQWVSFCAISGVLAADCLDKDFRNA
jgi:phytoene dehydrogenase-like protein